MNRIAILCLIFIPMDLFALQSEIKDVQVLEVSLRTLEYTDNRFADMALIKINKSFATNINGCNPNEFYLLANHDAAIYSTILAAKLSNKTLAIAIDDSFPKKLGWCKLVAIRLQ
jgi:hypothetical protein